MARNKIRDPDWIYLRNWLYDSAGEEEYALVEDGESKEGFDFLKEIHLKKCDIGTTRVDCSVCLYSISVREGAVSAFCPMCRSVLLFLDVTPEMFIDDET
jgi:hypothetical protein